MRDIELAKSSILDCFNSVVPLVEVLVVNFSAFCSLAESKEEDVSEFCLPFGGREVFWWEFVAIGWLKRHFWKELE